MMNGSKSATTTTASRLYSYSPGADFSYKIATRTFSRDGKRPATSPARIKHSAHEKKKNLSLSPEDAVAVAQSSTPDLQAAYGESLIMLSRGSKKVRPEKFLQLQKFMNQPGPLPSTAPTIGPSTPRYVKAMIARAKTASSSQRGVKQQSKATQYDYRSHGSKRSSTVTQSQLVGFQNSELADLRDQRSSSSNTEVDSFSVRCVRCSEYPDIQIEGKSLNRISSNKNILMSKEHCEVLGGASCPDCIRVQTQRRHDIRCSKNTPSVVNDVYKIALVHERSPNLTKREVERKLFDGEISDKLLTFPYWKQDESLSSSSLVNVIETTGKMHEGRQQNLFPDIDVATQRNSKLRKSSKAFLNQTAPGFETIFETSETGSDPDPDSDEQASITAAEKEDHEAKEMVYLKHNEEELFEIQVVPASEKPADKKVNRSAQNDSHFKDTAAVNAVVRDLRRARWSGGKFEIANQTESEYFPTVASHKQMNQRCFTLNVIPSKNFFFDISDLAERLRSSGVIRSKRSESRIRNELFYPRKEKLQPAESKVTDSVDKMETESTGSSDSLQPIKDFNMSYEPPVFYDYKGGFLGLSAATSRRSSVASKIS